MWKKCVVHIKKCVVCCKVCCYTLHAYNRHIIHTYNIYIHAKLTFHSNYQCLHNRIKVLKSSSGLKSWSLLCRVFFFNRNTLKQLTNWFCIEKNSSVYTETKVVPYEQLQYKKLFSFFFYSLTGNSSRSVCK